MMTAGPADYSVTCIYTVRYLAAAAPPPCVCVCVSGSGSRKSMSGNRKLIQSGLQGTGQLLKKQSHIRNGGSEEGERTIIHKFA